MTVPTLEEMAGLEASASDGPWKDEGRDEGRYPHDCILGADERMLAKCRGMYRHQDEEDANAAFIVAAREFVPWAIERIKEIEEELENTAAYNDERIGAIEAADDARLNSLLVERDCARKDVEYWRETAYENAKGISECVKRINELEKENAAWILANQALLLARSSAVAAAHGTETEREALMRELAVAGDRRDYDEVTRIEAEIEKLGGKP